MVIVSTSPSHSRDRTRASAAALYFLVAVEVFHPSLTVELFSRTSFPLRTSAGRRDQRWLLPLVPARLGSELAQRRSQEQRWSSQQPEPSAATDAEPSCVTVVAVTAVHHLVVKQSFCKYRICGSAGTGIIYNKINVNPSFEKSLRLR